MFDVSQIKTGLADLVGFRQNYDTDGVQLTELTTSESGLFVNDASALLTFDNLQSVAPQFDRITNANASANFTAWLKERTEQGFIQLLNRWLELKMKRRTAKNLLSRTQLFESTGNFVDTTTKQDFRVGFEITPTRSRGIIQRITEIGLQFTEDNPSLTIKLFQSGKKQHIRTFDFNYTGSGSVQWFDTKVLDIAFWEMKGGNSYYLTYDLNSISGKPINGIYDYALAYESLANDRLGLFTFNRFFGVHGYRTTESFAELGDLTQNQYDYSTNFGINLRFDVRADYTDFIIEQKKLFATAIQKQIAVNLLKQLAANAESRVNRNVNLDWKKIQFELYGDTQSSTGKFGLIKELDSAIEAIQFDVSNIDPLILPTRRTGVQYSTV